MTKKVVLRSLLTLLAAALTFTLISVPVAAGLLDKLKTKPEQVTENKNDSGKSVDPSICALKPYYGPKKRLGVMEMDVKVTATSSTEPTFTGGSVSTTSVYIPPPADFGTGLTEMLTTALVDSKRFIVLERKALADIQAEQALGASGAVDPTSAALAGNILGAQALIRGAVTEYSYKRTSTGGSAKFLPGIGVSAAKAEASVVLDIRIYDAVTGQVLDSVKAEGRAKSSAKGVEVDREEFKMSAAGFSQTPLGQATRQAIEKAVLFICQRMDQVPWEGRIAEIDAEADGSVSAIYLNAGTQAGLKDGDKLEIFRPGKPIKDPETRVVIGRTKDTRLGLCRIETAKEKLSIAVPIEGSGFQVGDLLRFVDRPEASTSQPTSGTATSGNGE